MLARLKIDFLVILLAVLVNFGTTAAQKSSHESKYADFSTSESTGKQFNRALELHRNGHPDLASSEYKEVLKLNPDNIESYLNLALLKSESGDKLSAINYIGNALHIDPEHSIAHYNLGVIYQEMGRYYEAESSYLSSIKYDAHSVEAHTNLGKIYETIQRPEDALEEYKQAIIINPNYPLARLNAGRLLLSVMMYKEALVYFEGVSEDEPDNGMAHFYMGVTYYFLEDYSSAWHNVHLAEKFRSPIDQNFLRALSTVMPEYQNSI